MDVFEQAQAFVVGHEGGCTAAAADPGNWTGGRCGAGECRGTRWGISAAAYPQLDIQALTQAQAGEICRRDHWDRAGCGRLPPPLALLVFDAAVNNGAGRAVRWLQGVLGVPPDGAAGPATLAAADAQAGQGARLCAEFQARRPSFMAGLPTWRTFGTGWSRRVVLVAFGLLIYVVMTDNSLTPQTMPLANVLLGSLAAMATQVANCWLGSSSSSAAKTEQIAALTADAQASVPGDTVHRLLPAGAAPR